MPFTVQDFRANLTGSGARSNLFQVEMPFPPAAPDTNGARLLTFMAKASRIPESKLGTIEVPYFGRKLKYPGDRTFENWSLTIINDENFAVRNAFERWSNTLNNHLANLRDVAAGIPRGYSVDATIKQYSKIGGDPIKQYKMVGAWPEEVATIDLGWDKADEIEEFQVTLAYQWWEADTTT